MIKYLIPLISIFNVLPSFAEPLKDTLRQSHEPGYLSVFLSLIFVICLIYVTGIVYNKLNHFGLKTLKAQNIDFAKDKITILSTTPLGSNKTLHVIELDGRKMIIGASANSIHLIKDLSENEQPEVQTDNRTITESDVEKFGVREEDENFGLYKKYLR